MSWHCRNCGHWIVDDWDSCTYCGKPRYGGRESEHVRASLGTHSSHNRSKIAKIDIKLPIKAFIVTIAIIVLMLPSINLVSYGNLPNLSSIFASTLFFINFLVVFVVIAIYDYLTIKKFLTYQALLGSIFLSFLLTTGFIINPLNTTILNIVIIFLVIWFGFIIGKRLYNIADSRGHGKLLVGSTVFLVLIWIFYLFINTSGVNISNESSLSNSFSVFLSSLIANFKSGALLTGSIQPIEVTNCISQVNQYSFIGTQKQTQAGGSSETTSISNVSIFTKYSDINPWIVQWASIPSTALFSLQQTTSVNCGQGSSVYICKDLQLPAISNSTNNAIAVGIVLEVSLTQPLIFVNGTETTHYLLPLLCTGSGTLLPNSKYYISH